MEKPEFIGVSDAFKAFLYSGNDLNKQFHHIPPFELYCTGGKKKKKKSTLFHSLILNSIILFQHVKSVTQISPRHTHGKFQLQKANTSENKEWVKPAFQHKFLALYHIHSLLNLCIFNYYLSTNKRSPSRTQFPFKQHVLDGSMTQRPQTNES